MEIVNESKIHFLYSIVWFILKKGLTDDIRIPFHDFTSSSSLLFFFMCYHQGNLDLSIHSFKHLLAWYLPVRLNYTEWAAGPILIP